MGSREVQVGRAARARKRFGVEGLEGPGDRSQLPQKAPMKATGCVRRRKQMLDDVIA